MRNARRIGSDDFASGYQAIRVEGGCLDELKWDE